MNAISIIFPHQLFEHSPLPLSETGVVLVEEELFFRLYPFHKQKIAFMRAAMKSYARWLQDQGCQVQYIDSFDQRSQIALLLEDLRQQGVQWVHVVDPTDDWLQKRTEAAMAKLKMQLKVYESPMFLNSSDEIRSYFEGRKRFFQTDFYIDQRKRRGIMLERGVMPKGGKWSFDAENRKKYPANETPPPVPVLSAEATWQQACAYTREHFAGNPGQLRDHPVYPYTFEDSKDWLHHFLKHRFAKFGDYEDAMVQKEHFLHHSVLSPMMNAGLLTPDQLLDASLDYARTHDIPLNSAEGFVRQIMGWREFIRAMYLLRGSYQRTRNFWGFNRKIPAGFYTAQTGIEPVDQVIEKVLETGYCHHIERLMIIGNFMLLCEFDPDQVYQWFMELFVDAWDWVMVPNVYGMSQFADGGVFATKPYISGSNYILKMSDFKKGTWQQTWDALFWRFMHVHRSFFGQNPRLAMLLKTFDRMPEAKRAGLIDHAENYLRSLDVPG